MQDFYIDVSHKEYTLENAERNMSDFHYHNYYEIYYLFSGKLHYLINCDIYDVSAGDIVLVKKEDLHMTNLPYKQFGENIKIFINEYAINNLGANSSEFLKCFEKSTVIKLPDKHKNYLTSLILKIQKEFKNKSSFSKQLVQNYIYELLSIIYTLKFSSSEDVIFDCKNDIVTKSIRYIANNLHKNLSLEELAGICHMNPSYFSRLFKKEVGIPLTAYVNALRIKEASELLLYTKDPVIEIAYKCGFNNHKYFGTIFKKATGFAPNEFRKKNKIKE